MPALLLTQNRKRIELLLHMIDKSSRQDFRVDSDVEKQINYTRE